MPNTYYSSRSPDAVIVPGKGSWLVDPPLRARVINNPRRVLVEPILPTPPPSRDQIAARLSKPTKDLTDEEYEAELVVWATEQVSRFS